MIDICGMKQIPTWDQMFQCFDRSISITLGLVNKLKMGKNDVNHYLSHIFTGNLNEDT